MLADVLENDERIEVHDRQYPSMDVAPEDCYYVELNQDRHNQIKPYERYVFRVLDPLLHEERYKLDRELLLRSFGRRTECFGLYMANQRPWIEEAAFFIGENDKIEDPKHSPKLVTQSLENIGPEYFLFTLAKNPGLMAFSADVSDELVYVIRRFCCSLRFSKRIAVARGELPGIN